MTIKLTLMKVIPERDVGKCIELNYSNFNYPSFNSHTKFSFDRMTVAGANRFHIFMPFYAISLI